MGYRARINLFKVKTLLLWAWWWVPALAVFAVLKAAGLLGDLAGRAAGRISESEPAWLSAALLRVGDMERRGRAEKRRHVSRPTDRAEGERRLVGRLVGQ